jgi:hypothetical protein
VGRRLAAVAAVGGVVAGVGGVAGVASAAPVFKAPWTCAVAWHASTYPGHVASAVDFNNLADGSDAGKPVLASAPGTATVRTSSGYGTYVDVEHGGGWMTRYAHLVAAPSIVDRDPGVSGIQVVTGDQLGVVGSTGTDKAHLHYEQRSGGVGQQVAFDGAVIPVGTSYTPADPLVTSTNCPTPPGAPSRVTAQPGQGSAVVSWAAPAASLVTGYTVTSTPGGRTCTTTGQLSCTVDRLANGTSYRFTVRARNAAGVGPASAASAPVVPRIPVSVSAQRTGYGNRLAVDVDPDRDSAGYTFRVQKQTANRSWSPLPTTYTTTGSAETRTITLNPGTYRVHVPAAGAYGAAYSAQVRLTAATVRVKVSTNVFKDQLRVDVDPNKGSGYWTFHVQKRTSTGTWTTLPTTYRTQGEAETRTIALPRGTYRVVVGGQHGYRGVITGPVSLSPGIPRVGMLSSAPVPSVCGHRAGRLVDGHLPGIPAQSGYVELTHAVLGEVKPGGRGAVAVLACSQGGVSWPDHLVFYSPRLTVIGHVDLYDQTRGGREHVYVAPVIEAGQVRVRVENIAQPGDAACCGTESADLVFAWDRADQRIERVAITRYNERRTATRLVGAIMAGQRATAQTLATGAVVEELATLARSGRLVINECANASVPGWPWASYRWFLGSDRGCVVGVVRASGHDSAYLLRLNKRDWRTWLATDLTGIAG